MKTTRIITGFALCALASAACAALTPEELSQLGTKLTPWGAEKAGNKDGTIPEYSGGLRKPPAGADPAKGRWPDPYPEDKPRATITAANLAEYADKLTVGTQELLKRYPSFRVDLYPTRRGNWLPKQIEEAVVKNASNADCRTEQEGNDLVGCRGGMPFPLAKTGYEAVWNHHARYFGGLGSSGVTENWLVDASGTRTLILRGDVTNDLPYYDPVQDAAGPKFTRRTITLTTGPARDAGNVTMGVRPLALQTVGSTDYSYTQGQRRVRLTPEFSYDTPIATFGGAIYVDEVGLYQGKMDRFDFKLVGRKEMILPFNNYRALNVANVNDLLGPQHVNPDVTRWELRRVLVVEATNKADRRHANARRTFYIEEDSQTLMASDSYDHGGKIARALFSMVVPNYFSGGSAEFNQAMTAYDLSKRQYLYMGAMPDPKQTYWKATAERPKNTMFRPDALGSLSVR